MRNRCPGTCADCGAKVSAGAGRWTVNRGGGCSGERLYKMGRGRREDALPAAEIRMTTKTKVYVEIEKLFTGGNLVGLSVRDRISETDRQAADIAAARYQNAIFLGTEFGGRGFGSPYIIIDVRVVEERG